MSIQSDKYTNDLLEAIRLILMTQKPYWQKSLHCMPNTWNIKRI